MTFVKDSQGLYEVPQHHSFYGAVYAKKYLYPMIIIVVKNSCDTQARQQMRQIGFGRNNQRPLTQRIFQQCERSI